MTEMTKGERDDIRRLIKDREKLLKNAAHLRSVELLAEFENQVGSRYGNDDDPVWKEAYEAASRAVQKSKKIIDARCNELGLPKNMRPSITFYWSSCQYEVERRKKELRMMAKTRIDAIEKQACVQIEIASVEAQAEVTRAGLTSEAAIAFAEKLPSITSLMPALSFAELCGEAAPPVVECPFRNFLNRVNRLDSKEVT
jgi:hypothetical protein